MEACLAALDEGIVRARARIEAAVAADRVAYDSTAAAHALEVVRGGCEIDFVAVASAFAPVISGKVADGAPCLAHFECAEPEGHAGLGPYCFDGCEGLFGTEEEAGSGVCTLESPVGTAECDGQ